MAYCRECGAEIHAQDAFCPECGAETGKVSEPTSGGYLDDFTIGQKVVFVGAALAAIGAFLPWITVSVLGTTDSASGIGGDGTYTLLGALVCGIGAVFRWGKWAKVAVAIVGALTLLVGLMYVSDPGVEAVRQQYRSLAQPGIGVYVTALGGVGLLGGPILDYLN
jgi:hypothetical protein